LGIKQNTRKIIKIPPCPTQSTTQQWELFEAAKLLEMRFMKLMQNGNDVRRVKKSFTYMEEKDIKLQYG
jgi:hypothetical protein